MPAVAGEAMVATSHPLAGAPALAALRDGGNAVDAALAAAATLAVAEPSENGLGGDAFALVWHEGTLHGLNGSGRPPAVIDELRVAETGPRSVHRPRRRPGLGRPRGAIRPAGRRSPSRALDPPPPFAVPGRCGSEPAARFWRMGHGVRRAEVHHPFGVGQMILRLGDALVGGSDGRGDGFAVGF